MRSIKFDELKQKADLPRPAVATVAAPVPVLAGGTIPPAAGPAPVSPPAPASVPRK
jgi:hypothetical protein